MFTGYLAIGGLEIGNNARTVGYSETSGCPTYWFKNPQDCSTLAAALLHGDYTYDTIADAPWYDTDVPDLSSRFLGVYIVDIDDPSDSTRTSTVVEKLGDGGRIGRIRRATRGIRVRAILTADGADALDYGLSWLDSALNADACGIHNSQCGVTDMEFFTSCPPVRPYQLSDALYPALDLYPSIDLYPSDGLQGPIPDDEYNVLIDQYRRFFHDVACTSGPFKVQGWTATDKKHVGRLVEFTITAEKPWQYGVTVELAIPSLAPSVVQDIAYNLVPYPSAELSSGTVTVGTNLNANPSVETSATGYNSTWNANIDAANRTAPGQSADVAANRSYSYRSQVLGDAGVHAVANLASDVTQWTEVDITGLAARTRISASVWGALLVLAGAAGTALTSIVGTLEWRDSGGAVIGSPIALGSATAGQMNGHVFTVKSQLPPAGAVKARINLKHSFSYSSSATSANNSDIRAYMDAVAVTVP